MIRLCAFADEADAALSGQIDALKRSGIDYIDFRGINGTNISKITEGDAEAYASELREAGIKVWSIGSPIGKVKITDDLDEHIKLLRHICRLAKIFGTDKIRMFSFYEAYEKEDEVFSALRRMIEIAGEYGIALYHENEKEIYGDRLERIIRIMENVEGLNYVYDPANFIEVGERPEITLPILHGKTGYFHIKDAIWKTKVIVPAGEGDGENPQHKGIINNFTAAILGEAELFCPGIEGIRGVELMNAIELSGWRGGARVELPVNEDEYLTELNIRRATSRLKVGEEKAAKNTKGTY